ncbi:hypothetical protein AKJ16_DCAP01274 [Drosera capensis]
MGLRALRNLLRPLAAAAESTLSPLHSTTFLSSTTRPFHRSIHLDSLASIASRPFDPLTDSRFPKRRPSDKPRRKRSVGKPKVPIVWVRAVPGDPIKAKHPNEGSVKLRNEKKRRRLKREFIKSEAKKRKVLVQNAKRRKREQQIERKMAAVAREREWAQRLIELQRLEEEKKKSTS